MYVGIRNQRDRTIITFNEASNISNIDYEGKFNFTWIG